MNIQIELEDWASGGTADAAASKAVVERHEGSNPSLPTNIISNPELFGNRRDTSSTVTIKIGDVVQLKNGGPTMTVEKIDCLKADCASVWGIVWVASMASTFCLISKWNFP